MTWGNSRRIKKYHPGIRILGIFEMIAALHHGRYVFVRGKAYHPAVLRNWSLASLEGVSRHGDARIAELTPEWIDAEAARRSDAEDGARVLDTEFAEVGETR